MRSLLLLICFASTAAAQSGDLSTGIAHFNARRWSDAHAFFAAAAKAQPKNPDALLWYGRTLIAEDNPGDAEDWFEKAVALEPRRSESHLWLARAIGMQAQRANPLRQPFLARRLKHTVDTSIELDPDNIEARELRWQYYLMAPAIVGGGEDKARGELGEIMRRNRYRGQSLSVTMAGRAKDAAGVERLLKSMVAEYPDSVAPTASYASWLADHDHVAEGFALIDAFGKRRPNDATVLYQIGRLAATSGQQLDRGAEALRQYIKAPPPPAPNVPTVSAARARLGGILERKGDKAGARAEYEAALKLDPHNQMAKRALAGLK